MGAGNSPFALQIHSVSLGSPHLQAAPAGFWLSLVNGRAQQETAEQERAGGVFLSLLPPCCVWLQLLSETPAHVLTPWLEATPSPPVAPSGGTPCASPAPVDSLDGARTSVKSPFLKLPSVTLFPAWATGYSMPTAPHRAWHAAGAQKGDAKDRANTPPFSCVLDDASIRGKRLTI